MELRDRIVREASILFFRNGVKSITMSDIANMLGISKRTLYEIFNNKEDLLEACIDVYIKEADLEIEHLIEQSENAIDALMRIYAKNLSNTQNINSSVLHDLKKYYAPIYKKVESKQKSGYCTFISLLEKGIQQGFIREDTNFEIMVWLMQAQFKALINEEDISTKKYSIKEFIRTIILNSIRGIATPAGITEIERRMDKIKQE